jgi:protein-disulfide isomerase
VHVRHAGSQRLRRGELIAGATVLVLILVAVGVLVERDRAASKASAAAAASEAFVYHGPYAPITPAAGDSVTMAQPGVTKPVLNIYEDYQCSICDQFELANGGPIEKLADQGRVKVVYHLFTIFLGSQPRQANSTRAWAAAKCVPAGSWVRYHDLLYENQPSETAVNGFPVTQLLALGQRIGLTSPGFIQCVTSQRYAAQIVPLSTLINKHGINATPTVLLNGRSLSLTTLVSTTGALAEVIRAAH